MPRSGGGSHYTHRKPATYGSGGKGKTQSHYTRREPATYAKDSGSTSNQIAPCGKHARVVPQTGKKKVERPIVIEPEPNRIGRHVNREGIPSDIAYRAGLYPDRLIITKRGRPGPGPWKPPTGKPGRTPGKKGHS